MKSVMAWQSLYDWCMENGERGKQLLHEFGEGNNEQIYENEYGMLQAPQDYARASHTKIKWTCRNNSSHVWEATIKNRTALRNSCPFCTGQKVSEDNSLLAWCKQNKDWGQQLIDEWAYLDENNTPVQMTDYTKYSNKKVLWKCAKQHTWVASISNRVADRNNCPYCSGARASEDNNLLAWCKQNGEYGQRIINEWTGLDENDTPVQMTEFTRGSQKKLMWKCSNGHEWISTVQHRTMGIGCPYCFNLNRSKITSEAKTKAGENDLLTWCNANGAWGEKLKKEWLNIDEDGNKIEMTEVAKASSKKVKWRCSKNHEFYMSISSRTYKRTGCPFCNKRGTSYPEQFLYRSLKQLYPQTINRGRYQGYEYDIMITAIQSKIFIEYSDIRWHADKLDRDEKKASICKENNIRFIQIYAHNGQIETDEDIFDENQIIYRVDNDSNIHNQQLTEILQHILNSLGHDISEINIEQAQTEAFNFMHDIEESEDELEDF